MKKICFIFAMLVTMLLTACGPLDDVSVSYYPYPYSYYGVSRYYFDIRPNYVPRAMPYHPIVIKPVPQPNPNFGGGSRNHFGGGKR